MEWKYVVGLVLVTLAVGVGAGLLLARVRRQAETAPRGPQEGSAAIEPDDDRPAGKNGFKGLGRKSLDSLRVGVVVLDADDYPVLVNPAARAMGLLRSGGAPGTIAAHPILRTLAGQVRRTGVRREVELDLPRGRAGGAQAPLGVHLRAVALNSTHVAIEAADVTEAHRLARVRRDFVANVSHELKTPIGALQLLAEALLDATQLPDSAPEAQSEDLLAARRFAERIHHESARMGRLVSELLELSRLQGAEPLPQPEPVSLDWVIAEVVDRTRTTSSAKSIEVVVDGPKGAMAYGNDTQIATAVTNLVENAIAYSGEDTKVLLTMREIDDWIEIDVADQGIGISPQDVDRIFERFYRADQARSRSTGGTGLGLAIVKHIATNHGGRVDVTSALGDGSTFTLRLPARPPEAASPSPTAIEIESGVAGR
ncbi:two-component system sensor histidine kinase SenX3 [Actinoplanes lutulentus]|uniref:Sensor-like histidine kinase SenX3 n=1 Tax=Actinoplanes lutulentus TaxID=1287878 RepID=A0A327ZIA3_9ACTN|nr:ATP-binding protein [Actinoplanes lutulentus]MBB2945894.1 two-component system sensor histidine kinase SenX3 [Actinoplanes lutulentus]RAK37943.1 two-component system sensor histidine kinase SenX3 [Actinoplanes lutulentus]